MTLLKSKYSCTLLLITGMFNMYGYDRLWGKKNAYIK